MNPIQRKGPSVQETTFASVIPEQLTVGMMPAASRAILPLRKHLLALNANLHRARICLLRIPSNVHHLHPLDRHLRYFETLVCAFTAPVVLLDTASCVRRFVTADPFKPVGKFLLVCFGIDLAPRALIPVGPRLRVLVDLKFN